MTSTLVGVGCTERTMINTAVPGEISLEELQAIEAVAKLVPPNGVIVEVGSYLGRSSWHWAKNVDPTVTVYCCDPWDGYRGSSLEKFRENTADCPNVVAMQGYSPGDFQDWDKQIDLYFEDAVHKNPILKKNLDFWGGFLGPNGILCGHDFAEKFPDVMSEASDVAESTRPGTLHVVNTFWFILNKTIPTSIQTAVHECLATVSALPCYEVIKRKETEEDARDNKRRARVAQIPSFAYEIEVDESLDMLQVRAGSVLKVRGVLKNLSQGDWPVVLEGERCLRLGAELHLESSGEKISSARADLACDSLPAGESTPFEMEVPLGPRGKPGSYEVRIAPLYEHIVWFDKKHQTTFRLKINVVPELAVVETDRDISVNDPLVWKQYHPEYNPNSGLGITSPRLQALEVQNPSGMQSVPSRLSLYEISLHYALAARYSGEGEIVDLGPRHGVSSNAIAKGLLQASPSVSIEGRVWAYDSFLVTQDPQFLLKEDVYEVGSIFERFAHLNRDYMNLIHVVPGDLASLKWNASPIELLTIGASRSWELNRHIVRQFFPHLIPGRSIVIQRDYVHASRYWNALVMEHMAEYFEPLYAVFGSSAAFKLVKSIPREVLYDDVEKLPLAQCETYFESALSKATPTVQEILKCAQVADYLRFGEPKKAAGVLDTIDVERREASGDPSADFSPMISGHLKHVQTLMNQWSKANP